MVWRKEFENWQTVDSVPGLSVLLDQPDDFDSEVRTATEDEWEDQATCIALDKELENLKVGDEEDVKGLDKNTRRRPYCGMGDRGPSSGSGSGGLTCIRQ